MNSISLITITLNSAVTLRRTLQSVLAQTRMPDQYVFVDGGSTDDTLEILQDYKKQFTQRGVDCKIISQNAHPNMAGIPHAWNEGIGESWGDVIAILNSDDWYENDALNLVMEAFDSNPDKQALTSPINIWEKNSNIRRFAPMDLKYMPLKMALPHPGCFFRREVYATLGTYNPEYSISADYDFIWRCIINNVKWLHLKHAVTNMNAGGTANKNRKIARYETYAIASKYYKYSTLPAIAFFFRSIFNR